MPHRAARPCAAPGCPVLVRRHSRCEKHRRRVWQHEAQRRGKTSERGYGWWWQNARLQFLAENPICVECLKTGRTEPAAVVDHIVPHKGDERLLKDRSNWQALCKRHHNEKTGHGE